MNQPSGKIKKILIVEDDKLDQKAIIRVLDEQGLYQCTLVSTLKEAREKLKESTFNIVLLDESLPDGKGSELFAELTGVPFVLATGSGSEDFAIRAYRAGASDYIIKDVDCLYLKLIPSTIEKALKQKELDQLRDSFASIVSHELRAPLTIISLGLENLQAGLLGPLSEKQAGAIERNIRNSKHLGKLIDNLLDLSRLESGRTRIERSEVDLQHLIHEVIQNFQPSEKEGCASVLEEMAPNLSHLACDPDLISQVLTNILSNAIRYAKEKIVVKAEAISGADGTPQFIQTSVSNDGPSIPKEKLAQIFEKFVQLDRGSRVGSYKGTGLGLAICREIIERHGGQIWVESDGEKGVEFDFTLPI